MQETHPTEYATFDVPELCCSEEMTLLEKGLSRVSGVEATWPDYVHRTLRVEFRPEQTTPTTIAQAIGNAGFTIRPHRADRVEPAKEPWRWRGTTAVGGGLLATAMTARLLLGETTAVVAVLLVASTIFSAVPVFRAAVRAVRLWALDMNVLMSIAALGAMAIGDYFEGATAMFLFAVSLWLESHSMDRSRRAVASLMELSPPVAHRIDGQRIADIDPAVLAVGDCVLVRPGERVPIDGVVLHGDSSVDQSPITGESVPVEKTAGDQVFAGTLNGEGSLRVEARRTADASTLARVARLVAEAESHRAPTE
ncbi:MAG TPA: HAD-IC family P-type ATPase, partial [Thermoguttaceae bacterium]|nr:HAD-IC family P-type ATPase [Thermoguttaceae bacterium]